MRKGSEVQGSEVQMFKGSGLSEQVKAGPGSRVEKDSGVGTRGKERLKGEPELSHPSNLSVGACR
jgi:hypothetical protein